MPQGWSGTHSPTFSSVLIAFFSGSRRSFREIRIKTHIVLFVVTKQNILMIDQNQWRHDNESFAPTGSESRGKQGKDCILITPAPRPLTLMKGKAFCAGRELLALREPSDYKS